MKTILAVFITIMLVGYFYGKLTGTPETLSKRINGSDVSLSSHQQVANTLLVIGLVGTGVSFVLGAAMLFINFFLRLAS